MEKEFIPYEQALALKKLGFDKACCGYFGKNEKIYECNFREEHPPTTILAPLYQQAFKWFREKYNLVVEISITDVKLKYEINIFSKTVKRQLLIRTTYEDIFQYQFKTYEEAELACLKKLIEISAKTKENQ